MTNLPPSNTRPPPSGTSTATAVPPHDTIMVDGKPRIAWPSVFLYRWTPEGGTMVETSLPPPALPTPRRMEPSGLEANRLPYQIIVTRLASYEALKAAGLLQHPSHWGTDDATIIDERKAPSA